MKCSCKCTCKLEAGDAIRHKRVIDGVRVGGLEPKFITYISDEHVCYSVYDRPGRYLTEDHMTRADFDLHMEKDPDQ